MNIIKELQFINFCLRVENFEKWQGRLPKSRRELELWEIDHPEQARVDHYFDENERGNA